jgi:ferrous iron transport protein B
MNCGAKLPVFALLTAAFFASHEALVLFLITVGSWAGALVVAKLLRMTVVRGEATPFVMELPPYRMPTLRGLLIHTWERSWQYVRKAGTVILGISILLWAMMTFPGLPQDRLSAFEERRRELLAAAPEAAAAMEEAGLEESAPPAVRDLQAALDRVDAEEAGAALRHSVAGRIGTALESVSRFAGLD